MTENSEPPSPGPPSAIIFMLAGFAFLVGGVLRSVLPSWVWPVLVVVALGSWVVTRARRSH